MNSFIGIRHATDFNSSGGESNPTTVPNLMPVDVRIRSAGEAMTEVARHLARRGIDWRRPDAVESLGVLGFRIWFSTGFTIDNRAVSNTVDVRLDGEVRFVAS